MPDVILLKEKIKESGMTVKVEFLEKRFIIA